MFYLIYGNSINLIQDEINKIFKEKKYDVLSLENLTIDEIINELQYSSMFDEEKNLVVKNFNKAFDGKKDHPEYLDLLCDFLNEKNENISVIFVSDVKIDSRNYQNKEILAKLQIIETPIITKSYELANILKEVIKKDGYIISQNALNVFSEKCNSNFDVALNEFAKIKALKPSGLITEDDVDTMVSNYNMLDMFSFKDSVISKNVFKALNLLDELEYAKMELLPLVVMLAKEYQLMYNVKALFEEKKTSEEISVLLNKLHPYRIKVLREAANRYSNEELIDKINYLCNLDLKLISEDNLGYLELKNFIVSL